MIPNNSSNLRARNLKSDGKISKRRRRRPPVTSRAVDLRNPKRISYVDFGRQAISDINRLRQFINAEVHSTDIVTGDTNMVTGGTITLLNGLTTGDNNNNRTGISIKMSRLDVRYIIKASAAAATCFARVMFVLDKHSDSTTPAVTDILTSSTVVSPYALSGTDNFVILYDETHAFCNSGNQVFTIARTLPANQHVRYLASSNAGTIADIETNALFMIFLSDQAVNYPVFNGYQRLWFIDN